MAITYVGTVFAHGSDTGTNAWPTHATDDIGILEVETRVTESAPPTPSGWNLLFHLTSAATGTAQARGSVFWRRATSGSETAPSIATGVVDHWASRLYVYRGCATSVSPIADFASGSRTGISGAFTGFGQVTTTADGQMIHCGIMAGNNKAVSSWGDSDLASITEVTANLSNIGSDSTMGSAYGIKTTAGAVGTNATVTIAAALVSSTIALQEEPAGGDTDVLANTEALTLTTQQATIANDINVNAATEELTFTTLQATITSDVDVLANTEALTLSTYAASISYDVDVLANTEAVTLTTFPANIQVAGNTEVSANVESLNLTTYKATISNELATTQFSGGWYEWTPTKKKKKQDEPKILDEIEAVIEKAPAKVSKEVKVDLAAVRTAIAKSSAAEYLSNIAALAESVKALDARFAEELRQVQIHQEIKRARDEEEAAFFMLMVA